MEDLDLGLLLVHCAVPAGMLSFLRLGELKLARICCKLPWSSWSSVERSCDLLLKYGLGARDDAAQGALVRGIHGEAGPPPDPSSKPLRLSHLYTYIQNHK